MARSGGARAWQFLRRNSGYREAFEARAGEAPAFEDAPFPLRRQSPTERAAACFGLHGFEDPFAEAGPASPFWAVAPTLRAVAVPGEGCGVAALARAAGTALAGLRLDDGALLLKLERGGRVRQVRIAEGDAFDPRADNIEVRLRPGAGSAGPHARSGELLRLLGGPAPPTGRGRGPGIANCCKRLTSRGPDDRSRRSRRRCGAGARSRACGTRTTASASGCGDVSGARSTSSRKAI